MVCSTIVFCVIQCGLCPTIGVVLYSNSKTTIQQTITLNGSTIYHFKGINTYIH